MTKSMDSSVRMEAVAQRYAIQRLRSGVCHVEQWIMVDGHYTTMTSGEGEKMRLTRTMMGSFFAKVGLITSVI